MNDDKQFEEWQDRFRKHFPSWLNEREVYDSARKPLEEELSRHKESVKTLNAICTKATTENGRLMVEISRLKAENERLLDINAEASGMLDEEATTRILLKEENERLTKALQEADAIILDVQALHLADETDIAYLKRKLAEAVELLKQAGPSCSDRGKWLDDCEFFLLSVKKL